MRTIPSLVLLVLTAASPAPETVVDGRIGAIRAGLLVDLVADDGQGGGSLDKCGRTD